MIDNFYFLANGWVGQGQVTKREVITSGVSNADLIASQNAQNFVTYSVLAIAVVIVGGIFAYMFTTMKDGFKEAKAERTTGFKEAKAERDEGFKAAQNERQDLLLRLARIEQLLIYTKATEQGASPAEVEAKVDTLARKQLGLDQDTE